MGKVLKTIAGVALLVAAAIVVPHLAAVFAALGLPAAAATAIASVAVGLAISQIGRVLASTPSTKPQPFNYRQSGGNSWIIIGKRRQGGKIIFYHPRKSGSDHFRYFVFAAAGHQCKGVTRWWLNDELVTVDGSGAVTSGAYAGNAWLWFARGTPDQVANSTFVSECGGKWTSNHRGRGNALIYAKFKLTKDVVTAGMPVVTAEIEGSDQIYDPRTASVGYSRNAVLAAYWWMQLPREQGGFGSADDEIPHDDLLTIWANICDEDVPKLTGTEKRYEIDALIETGSEPSKVRDTFVLCMAGSHCTSEGIEWLRPGAWVDPTVTLLERDLAGPIRLPLLGDPQQMATEVNGTYVEPDTLYQPAPVPVRDVVSDDVQQASFDLPFITSHTRAQRILEIMLRRAQCEKRLTWPMNIMGLGIRAMQAVQVDSERHGLSNYAWIVDGWSLTHGAEGPGVTINLREENEDIYAAPVLKAKPAGATPATAEPVPEEADSALTANSATTASNVGGTWDAAAIANLEARITALETP